MAEAVLFDIATNIILNLSSGVLNEIALWWGVNDELQKLKNTVSTIRAVLLDAEEQYSKSNQVKDWLGKLKEAVYDANDLLDLFSTQALKKQTMTGTKLGKEVRLFFSSSNQFAYGLKMAHKIKSIRERLDEINADKSFHLEVRLVEHVAMVTREREQTHSSPPNEVVGRGDDKTEILKVLFCPDFENNISVISIVGFGGLGKTTLAQLLLNDEEVRTHFKLKLWVCVAENFDIKSVVEKILESIRGEKPKNLEMDSLKNQLLESIRATKYLLVLDDVWNEDPKKWFDLMNLLVKGADGSKIIITTRLRKVAMIAKSILVHELKGLSNVESWELFKKFAFLGGMSSSNLEKIGKEIVEKCVGVPLAIKTIGSLLYFKDTESEWLSFKDEELSSINQQQNDILPTLRLSYNHLPSHLKHCFAYCRLFPKDHRINVESLAELWIAQGFVQPSNVTLNVKDIGFQYFKDLLLRSFFQEVEVDSWGNISTCKMHDLMHDLAVLVAREECTSLNSTGNVNEKARHISVDFDLGFTWQQLPSLLKASKARTLLLVNKHKVGFIGNMFPPEDEIGKEGCDLIFCNLKCMRVLDLHSLGMERVPHSIKKLELLRYLDLSYNHWLKKLSNSISKLPNLQVLKVDHCERLEHWPKHINKLVSLSSLSMIGCHRLTHMPRGIGQLKGLMKLSTFIVDKQRCGGAGLNELNHLNNLRGNLRIENLRHVQNPEFVNLREKQHLRALELLWNSYGDEDENGDFVTDIGKDEMVLEVLQPHQNLKVLSLNFYRGAKLSSWISSLTALVEFQLSDCRNIQRLPPLDNFPALKTLELSELQNLEYIESGNGLPLFFPSLKELSIFWCRNLKGWLRLEDNDGGTTVSLSPLPSFHCLSKLIIHDCPQLNSVPPFPSVETLYLKAENTKSLEELLNSNISASSSSSQLKELRIFGVNNGTFLPGELQQKLTSLTMLHIQSCPGIWEMECQDLRSLRYLYIGFMDDMAYLPNWLQYLSTLTRLEIESCANLVCLPEWMSNLTSLEHLDIGDCHWLSTRCKNNKCQDWATIAHIPNVTVEGSRVQSKGQYIGD